MTKSPGNSKANHLKAGKNPIHSRSQNRPGHPFPGIFRPKLQKNIPNFHKCSKKVTLLRLPKSDR